MTEIKDLYKEESKRHDTFHFIIERNTSRCTWIEHIEIINLAKDEDWSDAWNRTVSKFKKTYPFIKKDKIKFIKSQ
jgi:predicted Zn-dependent protease